MSKKRMSVFHLRLEEGKKLKALRTWIAERMSVLAGRMGVRAVPVSMVTNSVAVDTALDVAHFVLTDENLLTIYKDRLLKLVNGRFEECLVKTLRDFGHEDVRSEWDVDGQLTISASAGTAVFQAFVFNGASGASLSETAADMALRGNR